MKYPAIVLLFLCISCIVVNAQNSFDNDVIISDFKQGTVTVSPQIAVCADDKVHGNCVSIAIIKAALVEFGSIENIFKEYAVENGIIYCTFLDDVRVELTREEILLTQDLSGIEKAENSKYYNDGIILYALMCKRILTLKNQYSKKKCLNNFQDAVEFLNTGYVTENGHKLLALGKDDVRKKVFKLKKSVVIWTGAHAAYCSYGIQDIMGTKHKIKRRWMKNPRGLGGLISGAYILTK